MQDWLMKKILSMVTFKLYFNWWWFCQRKIVVRIVPNEEAKKIIFHWRREERKLFINWLRVKQKKIHSRHFKSWLVNEESRKGSREKKNVEWVPSVNLMKNVLPKIFCHSACFTICPSSSFVTKMFSGYFFFCKIFDRFKI